MLLDILNLSDMHIGYAPNLAGIHTTPRKRTHPTPLLFGQRSSRHMRYGWIRSPGASSLMLLGMLSIGVAYAVVVRQTTG